MGKGHEKHGIFQKLAIGLGIAGAAVLGTADTTSVEKPTHSVRKNIQETLGSQNPDILHSTNENTLFSDSSGENPDEAHDESPDESSPVYAPHVDIPDPAEQLQENLDYLNSIYDDLKSNHSQLVRLALELIALRDNWKYNIDTMGVSPGEYEAYHLTHKLIEKIHGTPVVTENPQTAEPGLITPEISQRAFEIRSILEQSMRLAKKSGADTTQTLKMIRDLVNTLLIIVDRSEMESDVVEALWQMYEPHPEKVFMTLVAELKSFDNALSGSDGSNPDEVKNNREKFADLQDRVREAIVHARETMGNVRGDQMQEYVDQNLRGLIDSVSSRLSNE